MMNGTDFMTGDGTSDVPPTSRLSRACPGWTARLCNELCEIDMRFTQPGGGGIFEHVERTGSLRHRIEDDDAIEHARVPPRATRARLRGKAVRDLSEAGHAAECDRDRVVDLASRKTLDLSNPFAQKESRSRSE